MIAHAVCAVLFLASSAAFGCMSYVHENPDRVLYEAFRRAFNALRLNSSAVSQAFFEFDQLSRRGGRSVVAAHPYCTFVAMAELSLVYCDLAVFMAAAIA